MQPINQSSPSMGIDMTQVVADNVRAGQAREIQDLDASGKDEQAASQFEAMFASMLVTEMRKSMPDGFFGSGPGSDIYGQWFDQHMGAAISKDDGLGLAGMLRAQLGIERTPGLERADGTILREPDPVDPQGAETEATLEVDA
ncbi:MAG: rod-binding protein [Planctomycetota bacterium]|nr:rod-binding protein [Planctomycetota bacterium]